MRTWRAIQMTSSSRQHPDRDPEQRKDRRGPKADNALLHAQEDRGRVGRSELVVGEAGGGDRTRATGLETQGSTTELRPRRAHSVASSRCTIRTRGRSISRRSSSSRRSRSAYAARRPALRASPRWRIACFAAGLRADPRRLRHAAAHDRAALPALDPPAPERRPRRVGAGALRPRAPGRTSRSRGSSRTRSSRCRSGPAPTSSGTSRRSTTRRSGTPRRCSTSST